MEGGGVGYKNGDNLLGMKIAPKCHTLSSSEHCIL